MPTVIQEPTLTELVRAFHDGVRAQRDRYADGHEGSVYDHFAGVGAIHWSRQARRDTDMFRAVYFATAEGTELTNLLADRYAFARVPEAYGTGTARLSRTSTAAGSGTVWKGTRIALTGDLVEQKLYVVTEDKPVGATDTTVDVSVRAERPGPGTAVEFGASSTLRARVDDPLWDTTWTVATITCADGTAFETAADARARLLDERSDDRVGFVEAIIDACKAAGAANAVAFPSDYGGDSEDHGLNMVYVGDAGFSGTAALVRAVQRELEAFRVLGDNLQVRALARQDLVLEVAVQLWDTPSRVNQEGLRALLKGVLLGYFDGSTGGFSYNRDAMVGAMMKASPDVQYATFATPATDAGVLSTVNGLLNFPSSLPRYRVAEDDVTITFVAPE